MGSSSRSPVSPFVLALLAVACGGGGGGGDTPRGAVTFAITDAASDEIESFTVEIDELLLTRASGGVVAVVSAPVQVDLAALSDLSQVVAYADLPAGRYTHAEIALDFSQASCVLVGQSAPAAILDSNGAALTGVVRLPIEIDGGLQVLGGRHRVLELDFDLDQSVTVDAPANTVAVLPAFVVRIDRSDPKDLIAFGRLLDVDRPARIFTLRLETLAGAPLDEVEVDAIGPVVFQVDGVPYVGLAGLNALEATPIDTWVQLYARVDPQSLRLAAIYVEAGAGTYDGGQDVVEGHVVDRAGGAGSSATFTVLGHSQDAAHTSFLLNTSFTVTTDFAATKVVRRGSAGAFDVDDVNVGQRVRVYGALAGTSLDATGATAVIRMQPTRVLGYAAGAPVGNVLTIDLSRVDLRDESLFDWNDSGTTPPDPSQLTLDVGTLGTGLGIAAGTPVEGRGFFAAVDDAAEDFEATSLANLEDAPALLAIRDLPGGMDVVTTASPTSVVFDVSGAPIAGELAVVDRGFAGSMPIPASPSPTVVPAGALTLCVLRDLDAGTVRSFLLFATFSNALDQALSTSGMLAHFGAIGQYDAPTNTLSAGIVVAVID